MEVWEAVKGRRSVRRLVGEVKVEEVVAALEAAIWAPSAHNAQPWRFIILASRDARRRLAEAMAKAWVEDLVSEGVDEDAAHEAAARSIDLVTSSPMAVLVAASMKEAKKHRIRRCSLAERLMMVQSTAAAIQNFLLALHARGLASCWLCAPLFCRRVVREALGLPRYVEPQALIIVGRPGEAPAPPPRRPLSEVSFINEWGVGLASEA
ncbi:MAG: nitroreductase family protein [Candidatus Nezhaarchaeota archaeon]|nr:nitroreductase family protein [Candidatus Nezhaarchaeota archaeon]